MRAEITHHHAGISMSWRGLPATDQRFGPFGLRLGISSH